MRTIQLSIFIAITPTNYWTDRSRTLYASTQTGEHMPYTQVPTHTAYAYELSSSFSCDKHLFYRFRLSDHDRSMPVNVESFTQWKNSETVVPCRPVVSSTTIIRISTIMAFFSFRHNRIDNSKNIIAYARKTLLKSASLNNFS